MEDLESKLIYRVIHNNDQHAFRSLILRYQSKLRGFLRKLSQNNEDGDDLAQESFLQAYRSIKQLKLEGTFEAWLFQIGYRVFLQFARKKKLQYETLSEDISLTVTMDQQEEDKNRLEKALKGLHLDERLVVLLHYQHEFTHSEISKITTLPLGTVKSHIMRGTEKLKKQLGVENVG